MRALWLEAKQLDAREVPRPAPPPSDALVRVTLAGVCNTDLEVGSRCGPFAPALALLAGGALEVADMVDQRFALDDGVAAFEKAAAPGVLKVLIRP